MSAPVFVCLTNIPTSYRLFQFARMNEALLERGWNFEVWFMAGSERGREWTFAPSAFRFPHRFLRGVHLRVGPNSLHCNHELLRALRDTHPEILLVAGAWIHPTVWAAALSSVPQRTIFWSESHLRSIRRNGPVTRFARRQVLSKFQEFAVPGALAKEYVEHHTHAPCIRLLPNLVNPSVFRNDSAKRRNSAPFDRDNQDRRVLLIVARLATEKGLLPFFEGISRLNREDRSRLTVLIAGSGPLRSKLAHWIVDRDLDIRFLGQQHESRIAELYAQADGFCLPSLWEPNPLSVIEALWAGLPLLLSSRVGNHPECLQVGKNGFIYDPCSVEDVSRAVSAWLALSREELTHFGRVSLAIARERFDPDRVISGFLDDVLDASNTAAGESVVASTSAR
ncbi:MAG TPA: glycosyltransferase family 4 protein [Terriglobales bacterium]|nr:glycosyltransferase family 4 protein [Terriglobales bacterium]